MNVRICDYKACGEPLLETDADVRFSLGFPLAPGYEQKGIHDFEMHLRCYVIWCKEMRDIVSGWVDPEASHKREQESARYGQ